MLLATKEMFCVQEIVTRPECGLLVMVLETSTMFKCQKVQEIVTRPECGLLVMVLETSTMFKCQKDYHF